MEFTVLTGDRWNRKSIQEAAISKLQFITI
jgi:hypothetical protein